MKTCVQKPRYAFHELNHVIEHLTGQVTDMTQ